MNILVVDDEADIRALLSGILEDYGYKILTACSYIEAEDIMQSIKPNLAILDVWLGNSERDGLRILEYVKKHYEYVPVIMISGHATIEVATAAIKQGAYDFIEKPFDANRLITSVEKAIEATKLKLENNDLKIKAQIPSNIVGISKNTRNVISLTEKIAPLNGRCVILGPQGSDKETIAKEIHNKSPRNKSSFMTLNCRSYGEQQLEIALFGMQIENESIGIKVGALENISDGTLFIDDLSHTSINFQKKLLQVLREESFFRIGAKRRIHLETRIIAGLPLDIEKLISKGEFNNELYYRMNANTIRVAPLSERLEDIPYLINEFAKISAISRNIPNKKFSSNLVDYLKYYNFVGDASQLKNMIDLILNSAHMHNPDKSTIELSDLPKEIADDNYCPFTSQFLQDVNKLSLKDARDRFEQQYLINQLQTFDGNITKVAKFIGMDRAALHRKLSLLKIK